MNDRQQKEVARPVRVEDVKLPFGIGDVRAEEERGEQKKVVVDR